MKTSGTERYGDRYLRLPLTNTELNDTSLQSSKGVMVLVFTGCGLIGKSPALGAGHHPGSSPGIPTNVFVAQLVSEHSAFNGGVTGSNPVGDTKKIRLIPEYWKKRLTLYYENSKRN